MPITKRNSSSQNYTSNADGFALSGGETSERTLTISGGNISLSGNGSYILPGSSTLIGNTDVFTLSTNGLVPLPTTSTGRFLKDDGTWSTIAGGSGDMILASAQTNTGAKTFLNGTILLRNVANTFSSNFINNNTSARTYTLLDADMTFARIDAAQTFTGIQTFSSTIVGSINGNAATVTTNANLTGEATSSGSNAVTLTNSAVISKVLTGYTSGAGTVAASDNILQAIQKLNGNILLKFDSSAFTDASVTSKLITGYVSGAGAVAATDTILQAINKLNGNIGLKANIASPTFTGTVVLPAAQLINGVTLATGGSASLFLNQAGNYVAAGGASPLTTKGDIFIRNTTVDARLPVGTNGQVLSANSAQPTGLEWITGGAGGGLTQQQIEGLI